MNNLTSITALDKQIQIKRIEKTDYISLTDMAKYVNSDDPSGVIRNWMSNKNSFEFYSLWEELNNPDFNSVELHGIKNEAGLNRFTMTPNRWKKDFNSIGIIPSGGKYSTGTFAHPDIALEFASWLDPVFKLYIIKEFQKLKNDEKYQYGIEWNVRRMLVKSNYKVHTDAIMLNLLSPNLSKEQINFKYANEANLLNVALFGMTAQEFKKQYPNAKGNMRDNTTLAHLMVLSNLENLNAVMINDKIPQKDRLIKLNEVAKYQLPILIEEKNIKMLENKNKMLDGGKNE